MKKFSHSNFQKCLFITVSTRIPMYSVYKTHSFKKNKINYSAHNSIIYMQADYLKFRNTRNAGY